MSEKKFVNSIVIVMLALTGAILSGCTTHYKDVSGDYLRSPVGTADSAYYTQYEIGQKKVEGRGRAIVVLGFMHFGDNKSCQMGTNPNLTFLDLLLNCFSPTKRAVENAKGSSLYDICESNQADYLVGATFSYTVYNALIFSEINCKTTAFPAYLKKIDVATPVILDKDQRIEYVNPNYPLKDFSRQEKTVLIEK